MFKAVVTDLDGTLLDKHHFLSEYTKNVLNRFLDAGYKLYIATGRVEKGANQIAKQLNNKLPLITTNGARIVDENRDEIYSVLLSEKATKFLTELDYKKFGEEIFINAYSGIDWFVTSKEYYEFYSTKRFDKDYSPTIISKDDMKKKKYNKIFFVGKFENLKKLRKYLEDNLKGEANVAFVSENSLEVFDISVNKAKAAKFLLERDNILPSEVISFGDGLNDFEMLSLFENSYIMDNALDELKEKLPHKEIIGDSDLDSVAKKIEEVFKI